MRTVLPQSLCIGCPRSSVPYLIGHRLPFAQAHLGDLEGLANGEPMIDGLKFEPTKVCAAFGRFFALERF